MLNGRVYVNSLNGIGYGDLEDTTTFQDHGLLFGLLFLNKTKKKRNYRYKLALFFAKMLMCKYLALKLSVSSHFISMTNFKEAKNLDRHGGALPRKYSTRIQE